MIYPELEKKNAKAAEKRKKRETQAEFYFGSDSFDEYAVKCAVSGIRRKFWLFGLIDPFWIHYTTRNKGIIRLSVFMSVPLMLISDIVTAVICRTYGFPAWMTAVEGGIAGAFWYFVCGFFLKNCIWYVESFQSEDIFLCNAHAIGKI